MKENWLKYTVAFAVIVAALGFFIITALNDGNTYYYRKVGELLDNPGLFGKKVRISGNVTSDNFSVQKFERFANFEISDDTDATLSVIYYGVIPDAFEVGAAVLVEGSYDAESKIFVAKKVVAKCPSKYEAEESPRPDGFLKEDNEVM